VDHFDAAGLRYPTSAWTWDDMRDAALQLVTDADGDGIPDQWGVTFETWFVPWLYWVWSNGGAVFNDDESKCMLTEPAATEALQFWADLINVDQVAPSGSAMEMFGGPMSAFTTGGVSMYVGNYWDVPTLEAAAEEGLNWKSVLSPKANNGNRTWYEHFGCWSISADTEMPNTCWQYVRDFIRNFYWIYPAPTLYSLKSMLHHFATEKNEALGYTPLIGLVSQPGALKIPGAGQKWDKISGLIQAELDLLFIGEKTAEEAAAAACPLVDEELARS
jgi:multiple sugar transport system substrate-binding protein